MAIVASNGLTGPDGVQPTLSSLGDTGDAPSFLDNTGMLYSDDVQIRGRNSTLLRTNLTRQTSSRFSFPVGSGPWTVRFYAQSPPLSPTVDTNERRLLLEWGSQGLMWRESAARNVVQRLQDVTLVDQNINGTETGNAVPMDQLVRFEVMYDGSGTLTSRIFPGDSTTSFRQNVWSHTPGTTLTISGMRWYNYSVLQQGSTDANSDGQVTPLQQALVDLGYTVAGGVDGAYGQGTADAVSEFQTDNGLAVDGAAGAETRTAIELALALQSDPNDYPDPVWVGNLAITDTADWIGPLDLRSTEVSTQVQFVPEVVAEDTSVAARATVAFSGSVGGLTKSSDVEVETDVVLSGNVEVTKATSTEADTEVQFGGSVVHTATSYIPDPPPLYPTYRLAIYNPVAFPEAQPRADGLLRGYIYHAIDMRVSSSFNETGGGQFSIPETSPEAQYITGEEDFDEYFEVALELQTADGSSFVEPPNMRFYAIRRDFDEADRTGIITWNLVSLGWILRYMRMSNTSSINDEWAARYTNSRAAQIMISILNQYTTEWGGTGGSGIGITWNFTGTTDSGGTTWPGPQFDLEYPVTGNLDIVMSTFAQQRMIDWRFQGRGLRAYVPDTVMNQDYSQVAPNGVYLRLGQEMLEARSTRSYEQWTSSLVIFGDVFFQFANPFYSPYGGGTEVLQTPGVASNQTGLISSIRSARNAEINRPQEAVYRRFKCLDMSKVPLRDYNPGDRVRVQRRRPSTDPGYAQDDFETLRIREIVLSAGSERVLECSMTLQDKFHTSYTDLIQLNRHMTGKTPIRGAGTIKRPR